MRWKSAPCVFVALVVTTSLIAQDNLTEQERLVELLRKHEVSIFPNIPAGKPDGTEEWIAGVRVRNADGPLISNSCVGSTD